MGQGDAVLSGDNEVERQVDEVGRLSGMEERTNEEEELQNEEETGYEKFPLAETSANIRWSARGLTSVSVARGDQKGRGNAGAS